MFRRAGAGARCAPRSSGWRRSASGWRALGTDVQPERARRRAGLRAAARARTILPACRTSCARRRARPPRSAASTASTSSRCRARASSRSCSSPPAATCARRRSAPGSRAATTAARPTTRRSSPRWCALRAERARLLGYRELRALSGSTTRWRRRRRPCAACSTRVWAPARARAVEPTATPCRRWSQAEGGNFTLAPWDWRYYAEKLRKARFDLDESEIKPYLPARPHHRGGVLHGEPAVRPHASRARTTCRSSTRTCASGRCAARDGSTSALFFGDYFARPSKRSGAWMTSLRDQEKLDGDIRPLVVNVMNFAKGARRRADAAVASTTRARCSTNSATRCTGCCPT